MRPKNPTQRCVVWNGSLALLLVFSAGLGSGSSAHAQAGRGAGSGAAAGAIFSFLLGGDLGDIADSAAAGAATGAAVGAINEGARRRQRDRQDLARLRREEIRMLEAERANRRNEEQARLEAERRALAEERLRLERTLAAASEARGANRSDDNWPETEAEWTAAIGEDNYRALNALIDCQYERANLLAQAGRTTDNPTFHLASRWIEALAAVDSRDNAAAQLLFEELVILDDDVDSVQQASLVADQSILEVRRVRREESIECRP